MSADQSGPPTEEQIDFRRPPYLRDETKPWFKRWSFHERREGCLGLTKVVSVSVMCPYCGIGLAARTYRHMGRPATRYLDCRECNNTWDVTGADVLDLGATRIDLDGTYPVRREPEPGLNPHETMRREMALAESREATRTKETDA